MLHVYETRGMTVKFLTAVPSQRSYIGDQDSRRQTIRRLRNVLIPAVTVIGILFMTVAAPAEEEARLHLGQLQIHPFVTASDTFSDNIYFTSTDEKRDSIITYTPGIKLDLPMGRQLFEAQYYAVANRYRTYKGENTTDHNASGLLDLKIGSPFELKLSDVFTKGHEPRSSSATGFIEVFRNNVGTASVAYQLPGRTKVQIDAGKSTWEFVQSPFRDRDENFYAGYLYYRFLPKTSVFLEYDHKKVTFKDSSLDLDNTVTSGQIGITWEITEKSKGTIKGGHLEKDFDSPVYPDFKGWTGSIDLRHAFTEDTSLMIVGQRAVNETNVLGTSYFITTGAYGAFTLGIVGRLALVGHGSYGKDTFSNPIPPDTTTREDKTTTAGGGLRYIFWDWLEISADYNHRVRKSNIPINDYREHEYIASASIAF